MPESDAGPDVTTDAACDTGGACCCDIDVIVTPTCGDAGLVCPSFYTLLPAAECKRCVLGGDTGPGG
ncbi:MAG: hypothetical protein IPJ34_29010 [Myxococcales bacterium]|nr:hypothetical protein [Myxococcales bacterium]